MDTIVAVGVGADDAMSWVTVIWSVGGGACLTLAFLQFIVWWKDRAALANLVFSVLAIAVTAFAAFELALMRAETHEHYGTALRWMHVSAWVMIAATVVFVRLYLKAGRKWLAWAVIGVRTLSLILNFVFWPNINYRQITGLRHISFLGESVSIAQGVPNPWMLIAQFSLLLLVIFVTDAMITVWHRGDPRRALMVGGSIVLFVVMATVQAVAITWGIISIPMTVSLFYLVLVGAMAYELSYDLIRAAGLARQLQASEASLRESEGRFRSVADSAPVLIWMSGLDKLCTFFNKPWLEFTGRAMEQEMGNGWAEGVHPDDLQRCFQIYTEAFDARQPFVMQYRLRRHDGEYRWISDNGVPRYDAEKNFSGYIGSCIDVTELMKKEEALRAFEQRVRLAAKAGHFGVWELDTATNEVWMSDMARSLFQFDSETRLDHAALQARVHPEDRALRDSAVKGAVETQGGYEIEYRLLLPDGTVRWIGGRGRCVRRENREGAQLIGVSIDITPRKEAQDLFRLATEASPSGIVLVNSLGRIVLVNTHAEELFGYHREELVGKLVDILVPERFASQHPDHRAEFLTAPTARAMGAGRELFGRRKDGSEFPVEIGLNPIETPDGILVLAAVVDISARKLAEAEALQRREEVGHLSRVAVMGELAGSIAHELNQPLSGIISNASAGQRFIDRGDVDLRELRELLADIVADGRRAGDVIRGLQSMVKKAAPTRQRVNLNDLVMNVVRMIKPHATHHSCEVETLLDPNLPPVEADPIQLQQVLINLVINAFDAMRNTPLSRRKVVIVTERNGDGAICMSVRDYGTGIAEEARGRLFDQFFTTKAEGLGMGLGIVRSIVESHAGTVGVENVDGGGARFHFTLPASAAAL
jgi:PAS domain S-box-containing protein